ncbi:MAG TPA: O-antigen biosynthesis protein [Colwellia sp.]|nr:O-antigen biosynthesis protein [Colwellia sp.]
MNDVTILGAGIAGISASYHAALLGYECTVYEERDKPGGLVANFSPAKGFHFDNAIHLSFTKDMYVKSLFEKTTFIPHKPAAYCIDNGLWLKHPVQNNLAPLPLDKKVTLIESFLNRPSQEPTNYEEWLYHQYGHEISNNYPIPYTHKYWGLSPSELSLEWIGNRMRRAEFSEILSGALEQRNINHYYAAEMRYPTKGGYFEFIRHIAEEQNIQLNKKVILIDTEHKTVTFDDQSKVTYVNLISTLPLPVIVELLDDCPEDVLEAGRSLLWTTVDLISIGFDKQDVPPHLWFYIYDEDNVAARAYSPSMKSANNAPLGKSSLQFEIYNLSSKKRLAPDELKSNIKAKLLDMGICIESDILFMHHKHLPYGNVVFDHGMEDRRKIVLDYLDTLNIKTCGRFGEWDYLWSDQSFLSGKKVIENLALD